MITEEQKQELTNLLQQKARQVGFYMLIMLKAKVPLNEIFSSIFRNLEENDKLSKDELIALYKFLWMSAITVMNQKSQDERKES
jgi:hypothetical protein